MVNIKNIQILYYYYYITIHDQELIWIAWTTGFNLYRYNYGYHLPFTVYLLIIGAMDNASD